MKTLLTLAMYLVGAILAIFGIKLAFPNQYAKGKEKVEDFWNSKNVQNLKAKTKTILKLYGLMVSGDASCRRTAIWK
jgi:hypothetical protein